MIRNGYGNNMVMPRKPSDLTFKGHVEANEDKEQQVFSIVTMRQLSTVCLDQGPLVLDVSLGASEAICNGFPRWSSFVILFEFRQLKLLRSMVDLRMGTSWLEVLSWLVGEV